MQYFRVGICKCVLSIHEAMRISFQIIVYLVFCNYGKFSFIRYITLVWSSMELAEEVINEEWRKGAQYCHILVYKACELLSCLLHVCV